MPRVRAEEISRRLKTLLDELSSLEVHAVILASFATEDRSVVFGMETNATPAVMASLLDVGCTHIGAGRAHAPTHPATGSPRSRGAGR